MKANKILEKYSLQDVANSVETEFEDYFNDVIGKGCKVDILIIENQSDDDMFDIVANVEAKKKIKEEIAEEIIDSIEEKLFYLILSVWEEEDLDLIRERVSDKKFILNGIQLY